MLNDVPDGTTVVGVPARIIKANNMCISNLQMGGGKRVAFTILKDRERRICYAA